ncbi:MAG: hypothetical protein CSB33_00170 [Desulfobacterales bacterium]|nr:MAG: hypothetical protein CSB33_00170 [Desulfobacterales bacterium]
MRHYRRAALLPLLLIFLLFSAPSGAPATETGDESSPAVEAPLNPAFEEYIRSRKTRSGATGGGDLFPPLPRSLMPVSACGTA